MKSKIKIVVLLMFLTVIGCTHTVSMLPSESMIFEERGGGPISQMSGRSNLNLNEVIKNKKVDVMMLNGLRFRCEDVDIKPDTTSWFNISRQQKETVRTSEIYEIVVSNWMVGLNDGMEIGFWLGATVGLISVGNDERLLAAPVFATGGFLVSGIVGAIVKGKYKFRFVDPLTGK